MITLKDAILELYKENHSDTGLTVWGEGDEFTDLSGVLLDDKSALKFTFDDVKKKKIDLQAEFDSLAWSRSRQEEYPSIEELVVALYDTDDKSAIEAKRAEVKKKYPKP